MSKSEIYLISFYARKVSCEIRSEDERLVMWSSLLSMRLKGCSSPIMYSNTSLKIYLSKSFTHIKFNQELMQKIKKDFSAWASLLFFLSPCFRPGCSHHNVCKSSFVFSNPFCTFFEGTFCRSIRLNFFSGFEKFMNMQAKRGGKVIEHWGDDDDVVFSSPLTVCCCCVLLLSLSLAFGFP